MSIHQLKFTSSSFTRLRYTWVYHGEEGERSNFLNISPKIILIFFTIFQTCPRVPYHNQKCFLIDPCTSIVNSPTQIHFFIIYSPSIHLGVPRGRVRGLTFLKYDSNKHSDYIFGIYFARGAQIRRPFCLSQPGSVLSQQSKLMYRFWPPTTCLVYRVVPSPWLAMRREYVFHGVDFRELRC